MEYINGIPVWGTHDAATLAQIQRAASDERVAAAALMADGHVGFSLPIGGVVAYRDAVSPNGIGFDISCGLKAVKTTLSEDEVRPEIGRIMDEVVRTVVFGIGRTSGKQVDHPLFDDPAWREVRPLAKLKQLAREQLGTVGSGNHFVDIFADEEGRVWIGAHFGSRGFGHRTASGFLNLASGRAFDDRAPGEHMDQPATVLVLSTPLGQDYWQAMTLAGRYAYAGRDVVVDQVLRILGAQATEEVHNHHNFCVAGTEKVATPHGFKRMAEISAGDTVYTFDPEAGLVETTVTAQWWSGKKEIYTIATANRRIRVSADHPLLTIVVSKQPHPDRPWFTKRIGTYVWKTARELAVGDIVVCAEGYYAQSNSIGTGRARFIGAFLGDGWVRANPKAQGYGLGLSIGSASDAHMSRYFALCRSLWPDVAWRNNAKGAYGLSCSAKSVYDYLSQLGLNVHSHDKMIPRAAFALNRDEKLALMSGYFDSDGSISNGHTSNHGRGTIASVSGELVAGLRELAIGCSMQVTNIRVETRTTNFGPCTTYRCVLSAGSARQLELWHADKRANTRIVTVDHARLEPPKVGYLRLQRSVFAQRIRYISVSAAEDVYDLSVAHPSHSFVCEGMVVHNCWKERHHGEDLYVVRKGATPAAPGQRGMVGGSMGDVSAIVEGVDSPEAVAALRSTVHGAGRVMSRTQAAGKRRWVRRGQQRVQEVVKPGRISREMMLEWLRREGVELRGAGTDESPHVYRRLAEVLAAHAGSIRVVHTLRPLGVAMAPEWSEDPYRD